MLIVLESGSGQMCNKLVMHASILASAYERGYKIRFYQLSKFDGPTYDQKDLNNVIEERTKNPRICKKIVKLFYVIAAKLKIPHFFVIDAANGSDVKYALSHNRLNKRIMWSIGWPFYDFDALRNQQDIIREYFRPNQKIKDIVDNYKARISGSDEKCITIGVHFRLGDYKEWQGGKYYFPETVYKKYMDQLYEKLSEESNVKFLAFSNGNLNEEILQDERYEVFFPHGSAVEDLYLMSECDYLIGPPSTFSGMASYLGNIPKYNMLNDNSNLELDDLKTWLIDDDYN